jgi:hypothetical protein|tara:strand:+ start:713 stop:883 length:171 start_codon:yes stop_codon:yes gene_type:complete
MQYIIDNDRSDAQLIAARYLADKENQAKQDQRVNIALYVISVLLIATYLNSRYFFS